MFGCLCFATVIPHLTDKFAPRAIKGVFVGYPFAKKGYRVLDLQTKHVLISRDVCFYETTFPFQHIVTPSLSQLFPTMFIFVDFDPLYNDSQTPVEHNVFVESTVDHVAHGEATIERNVKSLVVSLDILNDSSVPFHVAIKPQRTRHLPAKFFDLIACLLILLIAFSLNPHVLTLVFLCLTICICLLISCLLSFLLEKSLNLPHISKLLNTLPGVKQ